MNADRERWERIKELFDGALERAPEDRTAFLRSESGGDETVCREVESLLVAYEEGGAALEEPAAGVWMRDRREREKRAEREADRDLTDRRIGPYRLLRLLGSGGMGAVYEAERDDEQYRKRVAIKLIRRGMDSDVVVRRFRIERQILAQLEHPNIARLLDGGVTEDGQLYFVMEYVEGRPIDAYCNDRELGVRQRLKLFGQVCEAVQFAHQNLVVHRDLKPGNILVTSEGRVKLLDFGIAKLLRKDESVSLPATQTMGHALTPAYASPEQVRGEPVTTATDVYCLGVVLYELLAGRRPYRLESHSLEEIARIVCDEEPTRPSQAASGDTVQESGVSGPQAARGKLEEDLDNIVLMALRKEPRRRYQSALQLREDIERYLEGHPVLARKDTRAYRFRKFIRRHRMEAVGVAMLLLALAGGAAATFTQAQRAEAERARAEQRFQEVRALAGALMFDVHDAIADLPGSTPARRLIMERTFDYLERLGVQGGDDPDLRREVAEGYLRLGDLHGHMVHARAGDLPVARHAYERALELASALALEEPDDVRTLQTIRLAHERLGDLLAFTGEVEEGVGHARSALEIATALAEARPEEWSLRRVVSHVKLGDLLGHPYFPNMTDREGAFAEYRTALAFLESSPLGGNDAWEVRRARGVVHERLGTLYRDAGSYDQAYDAYVRSLTIREALARENPVNFSAVRDVPVTRQILCQAELGRGRTEEALRICRTALAGYEELLALDPGDPQTVSDVARGAEVLGDVHAARGEWEEAVRRYRQAWERREEVAEVEPGNVQNRRFLAATLLRLARALSVRTEAADDPAARAELATGAEEAFRRGSALAAELRELGQLAVGDEAILVEVETRLREAALPR